MQTAMHPAFEQKLAVLAALLERSKSARTEAHAKVGQQAPRYQASGKGDTWDVVEIATGTVHGFAFSYRAALRFVDAMEAGAASKQGGMQ
ncbi:MULTISPECIES: hypothetical protein [Pseudomonas putida group]|uniref:hypothetical protein n=1 Tax=Pseudomonas putida group TaxID=136845 RepID=UPI00034EE13B|nr:MULTISPECIES: hypothetical protein [Pseudomonas putida group]AGN82953.1 hypothetical protein L483_21045 [Pseudomonas putida H8234]MCE0992044.1 hypothetical protein [Pseudomonas alloputida]QKL06920.1 hypothetical protein GEV41_10990 [Pseudomonas putida]WNI10608.1 hypothetical protein RIF00_11775 [Pseudomonas putida]HDS1815229.1 hypothetical protein [Pseudomonas putida]